LFVGAFCPFQRLFGRSVSELRDPDIELGGREDMRIVETTICR